MTSRRTLRTHSVEETSSESEGEEFKDAVDFLMKRIVAGGYSCQYCNRTFKKKPTCTAHTRRHLNILKKRYKCAVCHKCFPQNSTLVNHKRIHTGEKPFACSMKGCDRAFADLSTQKKHVRTHTGDKPYKCEGCEKRFTQSGNMHRHIRSQHPVGRQPKVTEVNN